MIVLEDRRTLAHDIKAAHHAGPTCPLSLALSPKGARGQESGRLAPSPPWGRGQGRGGEMLFPNPNVRMNRAWSPDRDCLSVARITLEIFTRLVVLAAL